MASVLCIGGETLPTRHKVLQSGGFKVMVATNEQASLAVCRSNAIHAVILDSHSTISGLSTLAAEMKRLCAPLPVVLIADNDTEVCSSAAEQLRPCCVSSGWARGSAADAE